MFRQYMCEHGEPAHQGQTMEGPKLSLFVCVSCQHDIMTLNIETLNI